MYKIEFLRKLILPIFSKFNLGNIVIKHQYTGSKFHLHSFRHKGYWYHGRNREKESMIMFRNLIQPGQIVIEIGGHIGYMSVYFSQLVGTGGKVYVFEPGANNLPYLKQNLHHATNNITLITKAVSDFNGRAPFYVEDLTGQNNSLVKEYEVFQTNVALANSNAKYTEVEVEVITLDKFLDKNDLKPDFIKIDVEGAELNVLNGMLTSLGAFKPKLMVEVTQNAACVYNILAAEKYVIFRPDKTIIKDFESLSDNIFCLHQDFHAEDIKRLNLSIPTKVSVKPD